MVVLESFLLQILLTVGIVVLTGIVIYGCHRLFYQNLGGAGKAVCYLTGFIGTPIHELSHALFCFLFGHKIVEIKLFQIDARDGTLGYVKHTYKKKNVYQRIGNFFIGIAPIVVISALMYLLTYLLVPDVLTAMNTLVYDSRDFVDVFRNLGEVVLVQFSFAGDYKWWIYVAVCVLISLHMTLSKEDIKGALDGIVFVLLAFAVTDVILYCIDISLLERFTSSVTRVSFFLISLFSMAILFSLTAVLLSFLGKVVCKKVFAKSRK